jgi:(R,R)-butanediol dehydrogenase/meso-butanediol dehydrogenase/diacetyl reductase
MQAVRWHGPRDVRVETVPDPAPGPRDVVLRVGWCGICGTDVEEYLTGPHWIPTEHPNPLTGARAPLTLGHEFSGEIVAVGREVRGLGVGDCVAPDTLIYCGHCYWCRRHQVQLCESLAVLGLMADGGLAEYCVAPQAMCLPVPPSVPADQAALAETLAVGIHALRRGRLCPADMVAIVGAGAVGLCTLQAAIHMGARRAVVVEPDAERRRVALALGASGAVDPRADGWIEALREATGGPGPDLVVECAGRVESASGAITAARRGGRVVIVGLPAHPGSLDFTALAAAEKEIIGSLSHVYDEDFPAAIDLLADGRVRVDALITHRLHLAEVVPEGFERLAAGDRSAIKILVQPAPGAP